MNNLQRWGRRRRLEGSCGDGESGPRRRRKSGQKKANENVLELETREKAVFNKLTS